MQIVWIVVSLVLAGSLALPRAWLHGIGIVCCWLLLCHALELGDPAFVIVQIACIAANVIGLVAHGLRGRRPTITGATRMWRPAPERPAGAKPKYWINN